MTNNKKGILLTVSGALCWGISGVCGQYLFSYYRLDSVWLTACRMILAGAMLLLYSLYLYGKSVFDIFRDFKSFFHLIAFSILGLLLCQLAFMRAIEYSNAATATVLQSLNVVIMAITISVYKRKLLNKLQLTSVFLAFLGVFLITTNGSFSSIVISSSGLFWGLISALGVVTYTLLSKGIISEFGNLNVVGYGMILGGLTLSLSSQAFYIPQSLDFKGFVVVFCGIVLIGTVLGFTLFLEGTKIIGPVKATIIGCIEPLSATVLSALLLGVSFGIFELIGFLMVISTVFITIRE